MVSTNHIGIENLVGFVCIHKQFHGSYILYPCVIVRQLYVFRLALLCMLLESFLIKTLPVSICLVLSHFVHTMTIAL